MSMRAQTAFSIIAGLVMTCSLATRAEASAILNGGFDEPGFNNWAIDPSGFGSLLFEGPRAHSGSSAAWFGSIGGDDKISQSIDTTPGENYTISFWLAHDLSNTFNDFRVWWDGTPLLNLVNAHRFGYTQYTFVATALDPTTTITFGGHDVLGYYRLDDVNVAPLATPEPGTLVLLGTAGAALFVRRRRKQKGNPVQY